MPECAGATDRGPRSNNEDSYGCATCDTPDYDWRASGSVFVLADGMGGHGGGEIASEITVRETIRAYRQTAGMSLGTRLERAILHANDQVVAQAGATPGTDDMGGTVVACAIKDGDMAIAHVGDSRAYLLRGGIMQQLTRDHLYVIDVLGVSEEEAKNHSMGNVVSRCIGRQGAKPDVSEWTCQPGDRVLLCSDGVSDVLSPQEIAQVLDNDSPGQAAAEIVEMANRRAKDNMTAVVVAVPPDDEDEDDDYAPARAGRGVLVGVMVAGFVLLGLILVMAASLVGAGNRSGQISIRNNSGQVLTLWASGANKQWQRVDKARTAKLTLAKDDSLLLHVRGSNGRRYCRVVSSEEARSGITLGKLDKDKSLTEVSISK